MTNWGNIFVDWTSWFRAVCLGVKPFGHYPPWVYLPLYPFSLLPPLLGGIALGLVGIFLLARYLRWKTLLVITSAPALISLVNGNIDTLLVGAFLLPLWAGVIVASCKPMVLWGWVARKALRRGVINLLPLVGVAVISLGVLGFWPGEMQGGYQHLVSKYDISIFPFLVPVGMAFLVLSRDPFLWMLGGAMLSPYLAWYQLTPLVAYHARHKSLWKVGVVWVGMWVYTLWRWG